MALNNKDEQIRSKILQLDDKQYDTQKGWDQLSKQLDKAHATTDSNPDTKRISIWKMVAAAVILLTAGFLTGRISSNQHQSTQGDMGNHLALENTILQEKATTAKTAEHFNNKQKPAPAAIAKSTADIQAPANKTATITPGSSSSSTLESKSKIMNHKKHYDASSTSNKPKPFKGQRIASNLARNNKVQVDTVNTKKNHYASNKISSSNKQSTSLSCAALNLKEKATIQRANAPLPVMGLAQVKTIPSLHSFTIIPATYAEKASQKESIYKKLQRQHGSSSTLPIKIRL